MKYFKRIFSIILLFSTAIPRGVGPAPAFPQAPYQKPQAPVGQNQPIPSRPTSYAQALDAIRKMPTTKVLINNIFTQEFINFVQSLNFSSVETKALLEAGMNIHAQWSDNNETNKNILSQLKNSIQSNLQTKQAHPAQAPVKPQAQPQAIPQKRSRPPQKQPQQPKPVAQAPVPTPKGEPDKKSIPLQDYCVTNNLVMTLDPKKQETVQTGAGAVVQQTLLALYEKASPVITTSDIFEVIVNARQKIGEQNLQKLPNMGLQQMISQAQYLRQASGLNTMGDLVIILLSHVDLNNFNYYFHNADNLVLIIPKDYIRTNVPKAATFNLNDQAKVCGFNPAVLTPITNTSTSNLLQQLQVQKTKPIDIKQFVPHLTAMFTPQKKNGELIHPQINSKWLIHITGHGGPAHQQIGTVREQLAMMKRYLANPKSMQIRDHMGRPIPIETVKANAQEYEAMVEGRSGWANTQLVPESAQIAGISAFNFAQLMKFLDTGLDTAYVHYVTCFAGGSNQTFVNETLSDFEVNFIVSTEGIHEGYTRAQLGLSSSGRPGGKQEIKLSQQSFAEFFRLLRMFFTQPEEYVKIKGKGQDPIIKIIRTISPESIQSNQPFVRFPGAGFFAATPISEKAKTLTQTIVRAHEIEKKPLDFSDEDIGVLIINTSRIGVPLKLGKRAAKGHTALVTPSPKEFLPGYEAMYLFSEVNWQDTVQSLLFNISYLNARMYTQTFMINTLSGVLTQQSGLQGSGQIRNFVMQMRGVAGNNFMIQNQPSMQLNPLTPQTVKAGHVGMNIQVAFEFNENIYQCSFAIGSIEKPDELSASIQRIGFTATAKKSMNMNALASIFFTPQEITQLRKPITMASISELIDDKIDKQDPSMAIWSEADTDALLKYVKQHRRKK